ncbi:hypothetical protein BN1708_020661, partial [Verticillium longisporum]
PPEHRDDLRLQEVPEVLPQRRGRV